jgi:uncharacterized protein YegJ (DUF2314 family)
MSLLTKFITMKQLSLTGLFFLLVINLLAQNTKVENSVEYPSISLAPEDSTFLALKDTAQKHLPQFISSLFKSGFKPENFTFLVKSDFEEAGVHEHMWSQVSIYKDGSFFGIFIDSPFDLKKIKTGDSVFIKRDAVEDWIITDVKTGKETGYFSKKYLHSKN